MLPVLSSIITTIALGSFGISPGNYSAITHVRDNVYAVVDDKDKVDGFKLLTLDIDTISGKVRNASLLEPPAMAERRAAGVATDRDCEGACYFPEANTVFVSGEEDQRILEYSLDGQPTGRELNVPSCLGKDKIYHNLGFEALTYNHHNHRFWTCTEATLKADGPHSDAQHLDVHNKLRLVAFNDSLQPVASYVYEMDKPETHRTSAKCVHGVPSIFALDDGRILVMEREGSFPKHEYGSWVNIKVYVVNPAETPQVSLDTKMSDITTDKFLKKTSVCAFRTNLRLFKMNLSNYEGMCLGPRLADGRQTLLLISDSQNGLGNFFYHIKDHVRVIAF